MESEEEYKENKIFKAEKRIAFRETGFKINNSNKPWKPSLIGQLSLCCPFP